MTDLLSHKQTGQAVFFFFVVVLAYQLVDQTAAVVVCSRPVIAVVVVIVIVVVTAAHAPVLTWSHSRESRALCSRQPWGHHACAGAQRVAALHREDLT